ncbi:MAG: hypothetical protein AAGD04_12620 [Pseudomonadota bacterium]
MAFWSDIETPAVASRLNRSLNNFWDSVIAARKISISFDKRVAEMEHLNAKSDAELAQLGLQRTDIARHVFRDLYHY